MKNAPKHSKGWNSWTMLTDMRDGSKSRRRGRRDKSLSPITPGWSFFKKNVEAFSALGKEYGL